MALIVCLPKGQCALPIALIGTKFYQKGQFGKNQTLVYTSPFYGPPYLFCPGDVAAPHSIKFFKTPHRSWISKSISCTNTEFPLVTSDTVSRPLPEHSTTQTPHNNPHVCRPHRNGTPSLLSERHNAARNTWTCGLMTRHAPPVMTRK